MEVSYKEKESTVGKIKHVSGLDLDKGAPVQGPPDLSYDVEKGLRQGPEVANFLTLSLDEETSPVQGFGL